MFKSPSHRIFGILDGFVFLLVTSLGCYHVTLVSRNVTTIESTKLAVFSLWYLVVVVVVVVVCMFSGVVYSCVFVFVFGV